MTDNKTYDIKDVKVTVDDKEVTPGNVEQLEIPSEDPIYTTGPFSMMGVSQIAVDFDGTCVTHAYPAIGVDIGAQAVLKKLVECGYQLILYTMRSGDELEQAVKWFADNEIPLYGIQKNPTQETWTKSNKCYAQLYIDDAALGCPLIMDPFKSNRPFVDWEVIEELLFPTDFDDEDQVA